MGEIQIPKNDRVGGWMLFANKKKLKNVFHDSVSCSVPPTCLKSENWQREDEKALQAKHVKWCILLCDKYE